MYIKIEQTITNRWCWYINFNGIGYKSEGTFGTKKNAEVAAKGKLLTLYSPTFSRVWDKLTPREQREIYNAMLAVFGGTANE